MMRTYLITGAQGHLGSTIIRGLRGLDCRIRGLLYPGQAAVGDLQIKYYHGDVTRPETLEDFFAGVDSEATVIHTAGLISIGNIPESVLREVNVEGTRNVIAMCRRHGVKRLVYVSSVHAIPEPMQDTLIRETGWFSSNWVSGSYARTKADATRAVLDAACGGLDAVVVHPSGIIGPYDDGANHVVQMLKLYVAGRLPAGVRGGYDFVDVRDVADGCVAAAERGEAGECYILANGYYTVEELLEMAREETNGRKKLCLPMGLAKLAAPVFEWWARVRHERPLYTRYALETLVSRARYSHEKAAKALGFKPREMRETISDTIRWLRRSCLTPAQADANAARPV